MRHQLAFSVLLCVNILTIAGTAGAAVTGVNWLDRHQVGSPQEPDTSISPPDTSGWIAHAITETSNDVVIGAFEIINDGSSADTLNGMTLYSYIEQAYSVEYIRIYHKYGGIDELVRTINLSVHSYQLGEILKITNLGIELAAGSTDTIKIMIDANTTPIMNSRLYGSNEYDGKGLGVAIMPGYLDIQSNPPGGMPPAVDTLQYGDAPDGTDFWNWCSPPSCTPTGYWVIFDTKPPVFELTVQKAGDYWDDLGGAFNSLGFACVDSLNPWCVPPPLGPDPIALGDSIYVRIDLDPEESLDSLYANNIKIKNGNWGAFVPVSSNIDRRMDTDSLETSRYAWVRQRIPDPLIYGTGPAVRLPIASEDNYPLIVEARDIVGNVGVDTFWFCPEVDTKKPEIDSAFVFLGYDARGDGYVSVGDSLFISAYTTSEPAFEVQQVAANARNFVDWTVVDSVVFCTPNSDNTVWRGKLGLTYPVGPMDLLGTTQNPNLHSIWIMAWDDACNPETTHVSVGEPIDLDAPIILGAGSYAQSRDTDSNLVVNYGDTVRVEISLFEVFDDDIDSVFADFADAGIGNDSFAMLRDDGTWGDQIAGDWVYTLIAAVGSSDSATDFDPVLEDTKDANGDEPPPNDEQFTVNVTAVDLRGNRSSQSISLTDFGGAPAEMDTRRPNPIDPSRLEVIDLGDGSRMIKWPRSAQANDAVWFQIFVDSAGFEFDFIDVYGATYDQEYKPDTNAWITPVLDEAKRYHFIVRTRDDGGNWEFNENVLGDYIAGDANGDGIVNVTDAVFLIQYIFNHGPAPVPLVSGDANCDGLVNVTDAVYLIQYIFAGGPAPADPNGDGEPDC
ncbi:MAG: dockerin type I repeat-containing protein [bacterium]